jgi:hypothetical protein
MKLNILIGEFMKTVALIFGLLFAGDARSEDEVDKSEKIIYKNTTEIDFDGLNIDAEIVKPQGSLILERRKASFNPLIQLRINWNEEIAQSTDDVK